jgi:hypothetical protein
MFQNIDFFFPDMKNSIIQNIETGDGLSDSYFLIMEESEAGADG